ncbi:Clp1/GlmU family protein [Nitrosomonas sp. ANs5]|uniref:Clp1/GlmU family protein n=1 Tax=Nitrosomonas sp. ANs5 TaxID=3423941 RepID=UPI003D35422B
MYHDTQHAIPVPACCAADIATIALIQNRRLLLHGPSGAGKSTLAAHLAQALGSAGQRCHCICADPGSPAFGLPGAIALARWQTDSWQVYAYEALCSLDAARFRLPLVLAVARLAQLAPDEPLLIDTPGVTRGVAGCELLQGLFEASAADAVLALTLTNQPPALLSELQSLTTRLFIVRASPEARRPGKRSRARQRTRLWADFLGHGREQITNLERTPIVGTPPPLGEASAWIGRQVALLDRNQTGTLAEVTNLQHHRLTVRLPAPLQTFDSLLIRDAQRSSNGLLETAAPFAAEPLTYRTLPGLHESPRQNSGTAQRSFVALPPASRPDKV